MRLIDGKVIVGLNEEEEQIFQFESFQAKSVPSATSRRYKKPSSYEAIASSSLKTSQKLPLIP